MLLAASIYTLLIFCFIKNSYKIVTFCLVNQINLICIMLLYDKLMIYKYINV